MVEAMLVTSMWIQSTKAVSSINHTLSTRC